MICQRKTASIFEEDQIGRVLHHLTGRTMRPIAVPALVSGARRGELLMRAYRPCRKTPPSSLNEWLSAIKEMDWLFFLGRSWSLAHVR